VVGPPQPDGDDQADAVEHGLLIPALRALVDQAHPHFMMPPAQKLVTPVVLKTFPRHVEARAALTDQQRDIPSPDSAFSQAFPFAVGGSSFGVDSLSRLSTVAQKFDPLPHAGLQLLSAARLLSALREDDRLLPAWDAFP